MRFRNLSSIVIDKGLWHALAESMKVGGRLPLALSDDIGIYLGNTLRVTIRPERPRKPGSNTASRTCGHISLYPCPRCSAGFLTRLYLHELVHAWLQQYHEPFYLSWNSCELADVFADHGFTLLGGIAPPDDHCNKYCLDVQSAMGRLGDFAEYAGALVSLDREGIARWQPRAVAET